MGILKKLILTEKQTKLTEQLSSRENNPINCYGFIVSPDADKVAIKKAVEEMYDVKVASVNTMNYDGKVLRRNTKSGVIVGRQTAYKKAIVTLKDGYNIDLYSNI